MSRPRARKRLVPLVLGAFSAACGPGNEQEVTVAIGPQTTRIAVKSAYAEYFELPPARNELRLTVADYAVSCEHWIAPRADGHALTVVIVTPTKAPPAPGSYGWAGVVSEGGAVQSAYALPKLLTDGASRLFEPGGAMKLTAVKLESRGVISGSLAFEFPGSGDRVATRISGGFEAKVCRVSREEH